MNLATVLQNRRTLLESARLYQCAVSHVLSGILLKNDLSDAKCTTSVDPLSVDITEGGRSALAYSVMGQIIDALNCDLG